MIFLADHEMLAEAINNMDRDGLVRELGKWGFGRPGQAVPTDWATYYGDDELRGFLADYMTDDR